MRLGGSNMEISHILYAVTLAENLNFSRTAEKLFITQPTLSQQIQKLERDIGFPIFRRNTKNVELTESGKVFINEARNLLCSYKRLEDTCTEINKVYKDNINLGTSTINLAHLVESVTPFMDMFPDVKLNLVEAWGEELKQMLIDGILDMVFVLFMDEDLQRNINVIPLSKYKVCVTLGVNLPLAKKENVTLEDLINERMIFSNERSTLKKYMMNAFSKANLEPQKVIYISMVEARIPILQRGDAIAYTMHDLVGQHYSGTPICVIPFEPPIYIMHALCTKNEAILSMPIKSLIEVIKQKQF